MSNKPKAKEHYACYCGFVTPNLGDFRRHFWEPIPKTENVEWLKLQKEGKTEDLPPKPHHSIGRVNPETGEITSPPYEERTQEEKNATKYSVEHEAEREARKEIRESKKNGNKPAKPVETKVFSEAVMINFVPKAFTCSLTPIMQMGFYVARFDPHWNWRKDMPFENFLDTVIVNYFWEHGVSLNQYITYYPEETRQAVSEAEPENGDGYDEDEAASMSADELEERFNGL